MTKALSFLGFVLGMSLSLGGCSGGARSKSLPPSSPASPTSPAPNMNIPTPPTACAGKTCGEPCMACAAATQECPLTLGRCDPIGECVYDSNLICPAARVNPGIKTPEEMAQMGP